MVGRKKERLGLTLGRTMFIHDERVSFSLTCVESQIAYRGNKQAAALTGTRKMFLVCKGSWEV